MMKSVASKQRATFQSHFVKFCQVSRESTRSETVCKCDNVPGEILTVGTTFYVPPNKIDFIAVFVDTDPLGNAPVLGTVIAIFAAFALFFFWAWREDWKDKYKVNICFHT